MRIRSSCQAGRPARCRAEPYRARTVGAGQLAFWPRTRTVRRPRLRARTTILAVPFLLVLAPTSTPSPRITRRTPATRFFERRTVATTSARRWTGTVWRLSVTRRQPFGVVETPAGLLPVVVVELLPPPMVLPPPTATTVGVPGTGGMIGPPVAAGGVSFHRRTSSIAPKKPRSHEP